MCTNSVTDHGFTRRECTPRRQSPSCRRTYTPSPSREDSSETDVGQSTSTRNGHKPLALPEVCAKHYQREYDVKITILPCTARTKTVMERFSIGYGKAVVTPCGLLQKLFQHYLSLPDVETNTMMCRVAENVVEKLSVKTTLCRLVRSYESRNCCKSSLYHTYETSTQSRIQWRNGSSR
jgi:hypothetical protein